MTSTMPHCSLPATFLPNDTGQQPGGMAMAASLTISLTIVSLPHHLPALPSHYPTISLPHHLATPLSHCPAVCLPCHLPAPLFACPVVSLPCHLTAPLSH